MAKIRILSDGRPNLRGQTVVYLGERWGINTHIRNGIWRIQRGRFTQTIRLTRNGKVARDQSR